MASRTFGLSKGFCSMLNVRKRWMMEGAVTTSTLSLFFSVAICS